MRTQVLIGALLGAGSALAQEAPLAYQRGELGVRYWLSSGETKHAHNAQGADPSLGNPTSVLLYENLDANALELFGRGLFAREWFLKSIAIGPYPREVVESWYLPLCEKVLAGELDVREVVRASDWALLDPAALAEKLRTEDRLDALIRGQRG